MHLGSPIQPQLPPQVDRGGGGAWTGLAWTTVAIQEMRTSTDKIAKKKVTTPLNFIFITCQMIWYVCSINLFHSYIDKYLCVSLEIQTVLSYIFDSKVKCKNSSSHVKTWKSDIFHYKFYQTSMNKLYTNIYIFYQLNFRERTQVLVTAEGKAGKLVENWECIIKSYIM